MAELYWIRLPEHTDVWSQGYVGVTKHNVKKRFKGHKDEAYSLKRKNNRFHNVIRLYEKSLVLETLVICDIDYAYDLEKQLRPEKKIGWNLAIGGENPVDRSSVDMSYLKDPEHLKKLSNAQKINQNRPEVKKAKENSYKKSLKPCFDYLNNTEDCLFWRNRGKYKSKIHHLYSILPRVYVEFEKDNKLLPKEVYEMFPEITYKNHSWIGRILSFFRGGWNPLEDRMYLKDFPIENK